MKRVTGIGGIFIKCKDPEAMKSWYARHLGLTMEAWGTSLFWKDEPHPEPYSVLSFFRTSSEYFAPSQASFMINFRVENLEQLVVQLAKEGVPLSGEMIEEEFGKFAWILDPEGNKIELWEQPLDKAKE